MATYNTRIVRRSHALNHYGPRVSYREVSRYKDPFTAVGFTRLDSLVANDPNRFVSGIYIDAGNANRAWITYTGFSANTPGTPGHVFEVTYDPGAGTAIWMDISHDFGDIPANDVVRDDVTGDIYVSSDFGVFRLPQGTTAWVQAAPGMPDVEVAGLTIVPNASIWLFAIAWPVIGFSCRPIADPSRRQGA